jgi:hypothetical protein
MEVLWDPQNRCAGGRANAAIYGASSSYVGSELTNGDAFALHKALQVSPF